MDRAQKLKTLALDAKNEEKTRRAREAAEARRTSNDREKLERQVITAALAGSSSTEFEHLDVQAARYFRDLGFDFSISSRDQSEASGRISWSCKSTLDTSLSEFDANFIGWLLTSDGTLFSQRLFDALENAAKRGSSGAKFPIDAVSGGFLIGKIKTPAPTLVGKILTLQGFQYDLINLEDQRVEVRVFWL